MKLIKLHKYNSDRIMYVNIDSINAIIEDKLQGWNGHEKIEGDVTNVITNGEWITVTETVDEVRRLIDDVQRV